MKLFELEISFYFQPNYAVPGGRISPSVSEADLHHHSENIRKDISHNVSISQMSSYMSRDIRFPTMWHYDKCRLRRAYAASFEP